MCLLGRGGFFGRWWLLTPVGKYISKYSIQTQTIHEYRNYLTDSDVLGSFSAVLGVVLGVVLRGGVGLLTLGAGERREWMDETAFKAAAR